MSGVETAADIINTVGNLICINAFEENVPFKKLLWLWVINTIRPNRICCADISVNSVGGTLQLISQFISP